MMADPAERIPTLTEAIPADASPRDVDALVAELQTRIAAGAYELADKAMRAAFAELEAALYEHVAARLRSELPELVDRILREHLGDRSDTGDETGDETGNKT